MGRLTHSILILLSILFSGFLHAQVRFDGTTVSYFGEQIEFYRSEGEVDLNFVQKLDSEFQVGNAAVPNFGVSKDQIWARFSIQSINELESANLKLEYPGMDKVQFFILHGDELVLEREMGERLPFSARENESEDYIIEVPFDDEHTAEVYISMSAGEQLLIPLKLETEEETIAATLRKHMTFGLYAGLILVMFFYNFFIYLSTRDRTYLFYVLYIFSVGLTQTVLQGFAFKFLWPDSPEIAVKSVYIVGALSGITVVLFLRDFMKVRATSKAFDNYLLLLGFLDFVALVLALFNVFSVSYNLINLVAAVGSLSVLAAVIYFALKGIRAAKFFLIAWSIFLVSVIVYVLRDAGLIPFNAFSQSILMFGSGVEVILLSFALADRINVLKIESQRAQQRELDAVKEKEKLVTEQNVVLENKVEERTQELIQANDQLNSAMDELKQAQVQLVSAEKMASLGQLTAGIAHEINNPINFVASSITPLKRDLDDVKALVELYDTAIKNFLGADQQKALDDYRKKIDYEFTLQEIDELLKGVDEGAKRTAEIVQGLKNFSRLDESESKLASIHQCLDSTLVVLRNYVGSKAEIVMNLDPNMQDIECFPGKLNQVFTNIIINAVQAMEGSPNATLEISTEFREKDIVVKIADNGPGIPDDIKEKIFEPFFTTKDVGEGTGLGLSIVYSIIEQHEGELQLESEKDKGTTFIITLPKTLNA